MRDECARVIVWPWYWRNSPTVGLHAEGLALQCLSFELAISTRLYSERCRQRGLTDGERDRRLKMSAV